MNSADTPPMRQRFRLDDIPEIYDFDGLQPFLRAYVTAKKSAIPSWTLGSWARQMGVANRSSVTRILKGERTPGDEMLKRMIAHFGLDPGRSEYLRCLALIQRTEGDPGIERALSARLSHLWRQGAQIAAATAGMPDAPIQWVAESDILMLAGTAPLERVARAIGPDRLEPIDSAGIARMFIASVAHSRSKLGPTSEFHAGFFVKRASEGIESVGVLYKSLFCDNSRLISLGRHVWGHVYGLAAMETEREGAALARAALRPEGGELLRMGYARSAGREWAYVPPLSDYLAYSGAQRANQCKYRVRFDGEGRRTPFDPETDEFWVRPGSGLSDLLDSAGFQPSAWLTFSGCEGGLYGPSPFLGD